MVNIYFHIGLHKTATTFLQKEVFPRLNGINYIPQEKIYATLRKIMVQDPLVFNEELTKNELSKYLTPGINLISAEGLSGSPFLQYTNRLNILTKLYNMFPDAKIIVGIRAQKDIIISNYKQYVMVGGNKKFNVFINPYKDLVEPISDMIDLETFKFSRYLEKIEDLFGRDNMHIYAYEGLKKNMKGFLEGILNFMTVFDIPEIANSQRNVSMNDSEIQIALFLNRFFKSLKNSHGLLPRPGKWRLIVRALSKLPFSFDSIMSDDEKTILSHYYKEDNLYIDSKYNLNLERDYHEYYFSV